MTDTIPIYKPMLPRGKHLLPYLDSVDAGRVYSNRGPLVSRLEERLADCLTGIKESVVTASSGTAALQAAILAVAGRAAARKPLALMPGYTFSATAFAAQAAGYEPWFCDLAPGEWRLRPEGVLANAPLGRAGVVIPVAPFGELPAQQEWSAFQHQIGIPVVIDAAASFEAIRHNAVYALGDVPLALSFHATKSFSTAEGGAIVWADRDGLVRAAQAMNFGMIYTRASRSAGFNGKLSEYHAAIGLAGLDALDEKQAMRQSTLALYHREAAASGLAGRLVLPPEIAPCYALFRADTGQEARSVVQALERRGIETRFWYGKGVQAEPYFMAQGAFALPETEKMAMRIVGIPIADDMAEHNVKRIMEALSERRGDDA